MIISLTHRTFYQYNNYMIFKNNLETTVKATYRENNAQYKTELHK